LEEVRNGERVTLQEKKKGKPAVTRPGKFRECRQERGNDGRKEREDA